MQFLQIEFISLSPLIYFFGGVTIFAAIIVIISRNPIHSVIFLILTFCRSACLLLILGVEFLAIIFLVVYVGAIAVLFLFVVMLLQIKLSSIEDEFFNYLPIGSLIGFLFLLEIFFVLSQDFTPLIDNKIRPSYIEWESKLDNLTNLEILGQVLYTHYLLYFLIAGAVLLVAIIAAIRLTIIIQQESKRQLIFQQLSRKIENAIFTTKLVN